MALCNYFVRAIFIPLGLALAQYSQAQNCTEKCCFWYKVVPGVNNTCVVAKGVHLRCEVYVPHDANNDPVGRVRWYRSLDLVTSEEVTDDLEHESRLHSSNLVMTGDLAGLYKEFYLLSIVNVSSSDNGYYWCQIVNNQICLSPSPYVNISVTTASTESSCFVDYGNNTVCATSATCDHLSTSTIFISTTTATNSSTPPTTTSNLTPTTLIVLSTTSDHAPIATISSSRSLQTDIFIFSADKNDPDHLVVAIPTVGCVLLLVALIISFAGVYTCQRRTKRHKVFISEGQQRENDVQESITHEEIDTVNVIQEPMIHRYEEVDIDEPPSELEEEVVYDEIGITNQHPIVYQNMAIKTLHDHAGLQNESNKKDEEKLYINEFTLHQSEGGQNGVRKADEVSIQKEIVDAKQNCQQSDGDSKQIKKISERKFSRSKTEDQHYAALDHSIASNPVQKGTVRKTLEESFTEDEYYSSPQAHRLLFTSNSLEGWGTHDHVYQKLGDHNCQADLSKVNLLSYEKSLRDTCGQETHTQQNPAISALSSEAEISKTVDEEQSSYYRDSSAMSERTETSNPEHPTTPLFDNSSLPNTSKNSTEDQAVKSMAAVPDIYELPETEDCVHSLSTEEISVNPFLLSACEGPASGLFDDPTYSWLPFDQRSTEKELTTVSVSSAGDLEQSTDEALSCVHD